MSSSSERVEQVCREGSSEHTAWGAALRALRAAGRARDSGSAPGPVGGWVRLAEGGRGGARRGPQGSQLESEPRGAQWAAGQHRPWTRRGRGPLKADRSQRGTPQAGARVETREDAKLSAWGRPGRAPPSQAPEGREGESRAGAGRRGSLGGAARCGCRGRAGWQLGPEARVPGARPEPTRDSAALWEEPGARRLTPTSARARVLQGSSPGYDSALGSART